MGSWWRVFGILLLATLIAGVASSVLSVPFSIGNAVAEFGIPDATLRSIATGALTFLGTVLASTLVVPFTIGVTALLYVDLRIRREGLDLKLQTAAQSGHHVGPEIYLPEPAQPGHSFGGGQ